MKLCSFIYKIIQKIIQNILHNKIEQKVKKLYEIAPQTTDDLTSVNVVAISTEIDEYMVLLQKIKLEKSVSLTKLSCLLVSEFWKKSCTTHYSTRLGKTFLPYAYLTRFASYMIDDNFMLDDTLRK